VRGVYIGVCAVVIFAGVSSREKRVKSSAIDQQYIYAREFPRGGGSPPPKWQNVLLEAQLSVTTITRHNLTDSHE